MGTVCNVTTHNEKHDTTGENNNLSGKNKAQEAVEWYVINAHKIV